MRFLAKKMRDYREIAPENDPCRNNLDFLKPNFIFNIFSKKKEKKHPLLMAIVIYSMKKKIKNNNRLYL